jgi:hypothetical protein
MKKNYQIPALRIVNVQQTNMVCASQGIVRDVSSSEGFTIGGASSNSPTPVVARGRSNDIWEDEEE